MTPPSKFPAFLSNSPLLINLGTAWKEIRFETNLVPRCLAVKSQT
jgi:hypothetical protein